MSSTTTPPSKQPPRSPTTNASSSPFQGAPSFHLGIRMRRHPNRRPTQMVLRNTYSPRRAQEPQHRHTLTCKLMHREAIPIYYNTSPFGIMWCNGNPLADSKEVLQWLRCMGDENAKLVKKIRVARPDVAYATDARDQDLQILGAELAQIVGLRVLKDEPYKLELRPEGIGVEFRTWEGEWVWTNEPKWITRGLLL